MTSEQARDLLVRYRLGLCTDEEAMALETWVDDIAARENWAWTPAEREAFHNRLLAGIEAELVADTSEKSGPVRRLRARIIRLTAAAAVVGVLLASGWWWLQHGRRNTGRPEGPAVTATISNADSIKAPAAAHATLTLAGGRRIVLDSAANGPIAKQGMADISKGKDGLDYRSAGPGSTATDVLYNTLYNPRSSRVVHLVLSDGTRVWLNAETTLRYPAVFTGDRTVEVNGEAYFEVADNAAHPFRVKKGGMEVQVLGTNFNVYAYDGESDGRITLLQGAVKVVDGAAALVLKPGQAANVRENGTAGIGLDQSADVEKAVAWKNGIFDFNGADIREILRQAARWYDLTVVYSGTVSEEKYRGKISRDATLGDVLRILELNKVRFVVRDKTLTIL